MWQWLKRAATATATAAPAWTTWALLVASVSGGAGGIYWLGYRHASDACEANNNRAAEAIIEHWQEAAIEQAELLQAMNARTIELRARTQARVTRILQQPVAPDCPAAIRWGAAWGREQGAAWAR